MADLSFIRRTMEHAASFTSFSGWGLGAIGVSAFIAAAVAGAEPRGARWLLVWLVEGALAALTGILSTLRKARAAREPLLGGPLKKFALALAPAFAAGAALTAALARAGQADLLPGVWLLLYGAGLATAGTVSVRIVPMVGSAFMALGAAALLGPPGWGAWLLAAGSTCASDSSSRDATVAEPDGARRKRVEPAAAPARGLERTAVRERSVGLDRLIHHRLRLGVLSALAAAESLAFNDLKALLGATDGNLSVQCRKLEDARYVICTKTFDGRRPRTEYRLAPAGRQALVRYLNHMEALIRATRGTLGR